MKHSTFQLFNLSTLASALCVATAYAADISDVIVRQQWPWSTDIKVEFKLTNVTAPVTVNVEASEGDTPLDSINLRNAITGDLWGITQGGVYSFMIDPKVAFGEERGAIPNFKVRLSLTDAPANAGDILYKIVDLKSPYTVTDVRRRDFYNGKYGQFVTSFSDIDSTFSTSLDDVLIWLDVTNSVYKTDKMVFRRIPAAGQSFQFQKGIASATNAYYTAGEGIKVSFARDFYVGVFEVTQQQYMNLTTTFGWDLFRMTNAVYRAMRPADRMRYSNASDNAPHARGENDGGVAYAMRSCTGLNIDLPTEAMWEYACRAGTDTFKYSGESGELSSGDAFSRKALRAGNVNGIVTASNPEFPDRNSPVNYPDNGYGTLYVGSLKPNAWGLYDMLGNVREWVKDRYAQDFSKCACYSGEDNVDPEGPTQAECSVNDNYVRRGGSFGTNPLGYGAMHREYASSSNDYPGNGARLCIYLTNNDDGTL